MEYTEFEAGLQKRPELINEIFEKHTEGFTKHLTEGKKMVVASMDQYTADRQKAIDEATKKNHSEWEAKVEKLTGQKRPEGKKGLEWFDEIAPKLKYLTENSDDDTAEGRANKSALKQLQDELKTMKTQLADKDKAVFSASVNSQVNSGIRALKFSMPGHIKDDTQKTAYQRDLAQANIALFNSLYTPEARQDGSVQFKDKQGNVLVNSDGEPLSVEGIFAKNHAHLLAPTGHSQGGSGAGNTDPNASKPDYLGKDDEAIQAKLAEMNVEFMSAKWEELYRKAKAAIGRSL